MHLHHRERSAALNNKQEHVKKKESIYLPFRYQYLNLMNTKLWSVIRHFKTLSEVLERAGNIIKVIFSSQQQSAWLMMRGPQLEFILNPQWCLQSQTGCFQRVYCGLKAAVIAGGFAAIRSILPVFRTGLSLMGCICEYTLPSGLHISLYQQRLKRGSSNFFL